MKRLGGGTWRGKQFIKWQRQVTKWEHTTKKSRSRTKKERTRWPWLTAIVQPASNKINDSIFVLNVIAVSKYTTERSSGKCKSKLSCNHRTNDLFISLIHCSSCWHTFMLEFPPLISIQHTDDQTYLGDTHITLLNIQMAQCVELTGFKRHFRLF